MIPDISKNFESLSMASTGKETVGKILVVDADKILSDDLQNLNIAPMILVDFGKYWEESFTDLVRQHHQGHTPIMFEVNKNNSTPQMKATELKATAKRPYACPQSNCSKNYVHCDNLKQHLKTVHNYSTLRANAEVDY